MVTESEFDKKFNNREYTRNASPNIYNPQTVNSSKIIGTRYGENQNDEAFWNENPTSKEKYQEMASYIPEVQKRLNDGESLSDISRNPQLKDTVNAYFSSNKMVKVDKVYDNYVFEQDGRHRVQAAQDVGADMPVNVKGEFIDKSEKLEQDEGMSM